VIGLVSLVATIVLVARHRVRRAWGWWAAVLVVTLFATRTLWVLPLVALVHAALWIDAIRALVTAVPAAPARRGRWLHLLAMVALSVALTASMQAYLAEAFRLPSASMEPTLAIGDHVMTDKLALHFREPEPGDLVVLRDPCAPERRKLSRVVAVGGDTVEVRCDRLYRNGAAVPTTAVPGACSYLDHDDGDASWRPRSCARFREQRADRASDILLRESAGTDPFDFPDAAATGGDLYACNAGGQPAVEGTVVVTSPSPSDRCAPQAHVVVPPGHVFVLGDNRHNSSDSRSWGPVPRDHVEGLVAWIWWSRQDAGIRWDRLGAVH
jgi:signal peptidase I